MLLTDFYAFIELTETNRGSVLFTSRSGLLDQFKNDIEELFCCFIEKKDLAKGTKLLLALINKCRNDTQFHEATKNLLMLSKKEPDYMKAQEFYNKFISIIYSSPSVPLALGALALVVKKEDELSNIPLVKKHDQLKNETNQLLQLKQNTKIKNLLLSNGIEEKDFRKLPLDQIEYLDFPFIQVLVFAKPPVLQWDEMKFFGEIIKKHSQNPQLQSDAFVKMLGDTVKVLGAEKCRAFLFSALHNDKIELTHLPKLMNAAMELSDLKDDFQTFIDLIKNQTWEQCKQAIEELVLNARYKKFPERDINEVISEFGQKGPDVEFPLTIAEIMQLKQQYLQIKGYENSVMKLDDDSLLVRLQKLKPECRHNSAAKYEVLAIIRETVNRVFGLMPYNVQLLNVLAFLNDPSGRRISQIKTGEGKSLVIAMFASYLAIESDQGIDIITTSNDLAIRDSKKYRKLYQQLSLTSGNNVGESQSPRFYTPKIIYGTNNDFRFGFLQEARGDNRPYSYVIVDEVDNMFLDTLRNDARSATSDVQTIYSPKLYQTIWEYMSLQPSASAQDLLKHIETQLPRLKGKLEEEEIQDFINSYFTAIKYTDGKEYVVVNDPRNGRQVKIVDYKNTGQIYEGTRWDKGLHSLVEVKHNIYPEPDSMLVGSVSNPDYFNKYEHVFGLTGTLGTQTDRDLLKQLYNANCYDSPSYRPSKKRPLRDIICGDNGADHGNDNEINNLWMGEINNVVEIMVAAGRPVLILCESINESNMLLTKLAPVSNCVQIYNSMQTTKADDVLAMSGNPSAATIATNTAGRGADINVTPVAEQNGGLHVILTFKCINLRVERQGFGRTGRQGREGTYQYIFKATAFPEFIYNNAMGTREQVIEDVIRSWKEERDYQSLASIQASLSTRHVFKLKFITLEIYRTIPRELRGFGGVSSAWAEYYTRMDRELGRMNPRTPEDMQHIAEKVFQGFADFWGTAAQLTPSLEVDLLTYLEKNNEQLAKKFVQHCPPQIVAQLKSQSSTVSAHTGYSLQSLRKMALDIYEALPKDTRADESIQKAWDSWYTEIDNGLTNSMQLRSERAILPMAESIVCQGIANFWMEATKLSPELGVDFHAFLTANAQNALVQAFTSKCPANIMKQLELYAQISSNAAPALDMRLD